MSIKRLIEQDNIEELMEKNFKKFNLQEQQSYSQKCLILGDFCILEDSEYVGEYIPILKKLIFDFKKTEIDAWDLFKEKYIELTWGNGINGEVRNINIELINKSPKSIYQEKLFRDIIFDYKDWNENKEKIYIEYFTNLFNTLKARHIGSLLKEIIQIHERSSRILIVNKAFFNTIKELRYIGDINRNIQFHVGVTNKVLDNKSIFIDAENKQTSYIKYDYNIPIEAVYISEDNGDHIYDNSSVKKTFFHNGNIKTYESAIVFDPTEAQILDGYDKFLTYTKYEKNASDQYNGIYLEINGEEYNLSTLCILYENGRIISSVSY